MAAGAGGVREQADQSRPPLLLLLLPLDVLGVEEEAAVVEMVLGCVEGEDEDENETRCLRFFVATPLLSRCGSETCVVDDAGMPATKLVLATEEGESIVLPAAAGAGDEDASDGVAVTAAILRGSVGS